MKIGKLQYITNGQSHDEILAEVNAVLEAGCDWVQLRIKNPALNFEKIAFDVKECCEGKATFVVNDRVDIAIAVDADGVHLGLEDMLIKDARQILGENKIIGGTANQLKDCLERQAAGANYIGLGPYRETATKKKLSPILGLDGYKNLIPTKNGQVTIPVIAIGGLKLDDVEDLKQETGIHGIAVSSLLKDEKNKKGLIDQIKTLLN